MRRSLSLDLLRAAAILLVMLRHLVVCPPEAGPFWHTLTTWLNAGGWVGVDLFFVLSGFLVGGLLFQEYRATGGLRCGRFYVRRGFKIYPLLWAAVLITWALKSAFGMRITRAELFPDLFFYASYVRGVLGVGWSLAVEEHFYLLLPLLLLLFIGRCGTLENPFTKFPRLVAAWGAGSILLRASSYGDEASFDFIAQFAATHLRLDSLFFGVLLAYYHAYYREAFLALARRYQRQLALGGLAGLLPAFVLPIGGWYILIFGFTVQYLAAGALLCAALVWTPAKSRAWRWLAAIGRQSYANYLLHRTLGTVGVALILRAGGWSYQWPVYLVLYLALSFVAAAFLTHFVERPLLVLRDRLFPAAHQPVAREPIATPLLEAVAA